MLIGVRLPERKKVAVCILRQPATVLSADSRRGGKGFLFFFEQARPQDKQQSLNLIPPSETASHPAANGLKGKIWVYRPALCRGFSEKPESMYIKELTPYAFLNVSSNPLCIFS